MATTEIEIKMEYYINELGELCGKTQIGKEDLHLVLVKPNTVDSEGNLYTKESIAAVFESLQDKSEECCGGGCCHC